MPQSDSLQLDRLDHFVLTVRDMEATIAFYVDGLGMRHSVFETPDGTRRHALFFGASKINLHQKGAEFDPKAAHPTPGSADLCFLTQGALEDWKTHLETQGLQIEEGPVARTGATGPLRSIYLRDPDQNLIEISVSE